MSILKNMMLGESGEGASGQQSVGGTVNNMFRQALIGGSLVGGAYFGYKQLSSGQAINPNNILNPPSDLGRVGQQVGKQVSEHIALRDTNKAKRANEILESLMSSKTVEKFAEGVEERNALIQSMLSTLDDPTAGFNENSALQLREQLVSLIDDKTSSKDEIVELLKGFVTEFSSGTVEQKAKFASRIQEFSGLGESLTTPNFQFKASQPFTEIGQQKLTKSAGERLNRLSKMLGGLDSVSLVQFNEQSGQVGQYARIQRAGGKFRLMPLDVRATAAPADKPTVFRTGAVGQTSYVLPEFFISAQNLNSLSSSGQPITQQALRQKQTFFEDLALDMLQGRVNRTETGFFIRDDKGLGAEMTEILTIGNRFTSTPGASTGRYAETTSHIQRALRHNTNVAVVHGIQNLTPDVAKTLLPRAVAAGGALDPNAGASRLAGSRIDNRVYQTIGLMAGSPLRRLRAGAGHVPNRLTTPVTARLEQAVGRQDFFTASNVAGAQQKYIGRGRSVGAGIQMGSGTANIHIEGEFGTTTKPFILDITGDLRSGVSAKPTVFAGLADMGQVISAGNVGNLVQTGTIPILDPTSHSNASTKLLNKIMSRHQRFLAGEVEDSFVRLDKASLTKIGRQLGIGTETMRELFVDERTRHIDVGLQMMDDATGKNMLRLAFRSERSMEAAKLFSPHIKGTVFSTNVNTMAEQLVSAGVDPEILKSQFGIDVTDILTGTGDMLGKAEDYISTQVISGMQMFGTKKGFDAHQFVATRQYRNTLGETNLGRVTAAAIDFLAGEAGIGGNEGLLRKAGMTLAAAYGHKSSQIDIEKMEDMIVKKFGETDARSVLAGARSGLVFGATSAVPGAGHGDWKRAMGGADTRFFEFLQSRLATMGMTQGNISSVISDVYKGKRGMREHLGMMGGLLNMQASLSGMTNPMSDAARSNVRTIRVEELTEILAQNDESLSQFLRTQDHGVLLDLNTASGVAGSQLSADARRVTGQGQIFLPGRETLQYMRGTAIKQGGGQFDMHVGSDVERTIDNFAQDLIKITSNDQSAKDLSMRSVAEFKRNISKITATAFRGITRGKIGGAQAHIGHGYARAMADGRIAGLTRYQTGLVKKAQDVSKGMAAHYDSAAFFGMLSLDKDASSIEKASRLESFFTALETDTAQPGLMTVMNRHPNIARGNVSLVQAYRDVREVGLSGDADKTWRTFTQSGKGRDALKKLRDAVGDAKISSFGDVARLGQDHAKARKSFFKAMADNLHKFANTGGAIYIHNADMGIQLKGLDKLLNVDMGHAGAMIGDFDGDHYISKVLSHRSAAIIESTLGSAENYIAADSLYKIQGQAYAQAFKEGLNKKKEQMGAAAFSERERAAMDLMKETGSKQSTGMLDVQLNKLRQAVANNESANPRLAGEAFAFMQMLEEHSTIKGKKLPIFLPWAEMLGRGLDEIVAGEGFSTFKQTVVEEFLSGDQMGRRVQQGGLQAGSDIMVQGVQVVKTGDNLTNFDEMLSFVNDSVIANQSAGNRAAMVSTNQLATGLSSGNLQAQQALIRNLVHTAGANAQAGILSGAGGVSQMDALFAAGSNMKNTIVGAMGAMDSKMMGGIAMGMAGALTASGLMGHEGYDANVLQMDGEQGPSANVMKHIGSQSLFAANTAGLTSDTYSETLDPASMMNKPITGAGTAYMAAPSSYSIHGNINGVQNAQNFIMNLGQTGVSGSVRINDTRRPITSNYMDRLQGEY